MTRLKLEMTSYSENGYDVNNSFFLKISWPVLYSYQVSLLSGDKKQSPPQNKRWLTRTPTKIGLNASCVLYTLLSSG